MISLSQIKKDINAEIKKLSCRPDDINFPNAVETSYNRPYMDVFYPTTTTRAILADGSSSIVALLLQLDYYVDKASDINTIDGYEDAVLQRFRLNRYIGDAVITDTPSITQVGIEDDAGSYKTVIRIPFRFTIEG